MFQLSQKLQVSNRAVVIQNSFNTDAHTSTCILTLSHNHTAHTPTETDSTYTVSVVFFSFYTQESGEPVNLFALFEGLRVVE